MRVRRAGLLDATLGAGDLVSYGRADGLVGLEGVRRHRSVVADHRGRVWFSTNRGLSVVQPRRALDAPPPPLVHVRALLADERPLELASAVRVPPTPQRVRIAYTGVSLQAPGRVRFRHRLDGFDARWSEPVSTEEAVYANLGPGPYRFRVQAAGADGLWTGPEATIDLTIAPALWQTAWFRLAARGRPDPRRAARLRVAPQPGHAQAQCRLRGAPGGAHAHRAGAARHAAAGLRQRIDAAARGGRAGGARKRRPARCSRACSS